MQKAGSADLRTTIAHLRNRFSAEFDKTYIEHVIIPSFLATTFKCERLLLPMIDVQFSKENALPRHVLGLLYEAWRVAPEEGVTVFLQSLSGNIILDCIAFEAPACGDKRPSGSLAAAGNVR